ncbi:MAG: glycosyltransferase [Actinomycetia bacterium]|nr:glycosyltransferase [Actinomycetes bacterium]
MATLPGLTPETLDFVLLSFEGPDQYAMAGGLGVRMRELALELARQGFRTHLVFVGDPHRPPEETPVENLTLHRWSQWLSAHYPAGVYHGEEAKLVDWNEQLPGFVTARLATPTAAAGRLTAILAEEWHTAYCTCQISDRLWLEGLRDKAIILWNANNVMGFDRIDWRRLDFCSQITTVSRYMKHVMWDRGVNPLVIPNGIPAERIRDADPALVTRLRAAFAGRELIFKIGRFSPDKRWNMAIAALAEEKRRGYDIATVIRGGVEPHGLEVLANAQAQGLIVADVSLPKDTPAALDVFAGLPHADVYNVTSFMSDELISLFYSGADAVLANSGHEPFGLVGLEVMAAGGVAFVGSTGEDYAVPFLNSVVLDTDDPAEIGIALEFLRAHPEVVKRLRSDAKETARSFTWESVVQDTLLGKLEYVSLRQSVTPPQQNDRLEAAATAEDVAGTAGHPGLRTTADAKATGEPTESAAYGGESVGRRLSVKPRGHAEEDAANAPQDPRSQGPSSARPKKTGDATGPTG